MIYLALLVASFIISLLAVFLIKQRLGQHLLDIPNDRSSHTQPTPRGGGLGFIIAFAATSGLAIALKSNFVNQNPAFLWLILTPLAIVGIIDDQRGVPASLRYLVQLVAGVLAVTCFGTFPQPWLDFGTVSAIASITLSAIAITAIINFYNFMDGLDGLVAGVTAVQLSFLALYLNQPLLFLLVAALLGFLWWNWSPARIFMGDAGSTVLGATIAIALLNNNGNPVQAWSALAITTPLIGDAIYTLIRRLLRRENIFQAHRSHLYQRLQQSGWSHRQVASTYIGLTVIIAISISLSGAMGALLSVIGVALVMILGEVYLRSLKNSYQQ